MPVRHKIRFKCPHCGDPRATFGDRKLDLNDSAITHCKECSGKIKVTITKAKEVNE